MDLIDRLIPRGRINEDRLLRAGAAAAAGDSRAAWVTLFDLATRLRREPDNPAVAKGALELMATLPEEGLGGQRRWLERTFRKALQ